MSIVLGVNFNISDFVYCTTRGPVTKAITEQTNKQLHNVLMHRV